MTQPILQVLSVFAGILLVGILVTGFVKEMFREMFANNCPVCGSPMSEWDDDPKHDYCSNENCETNKKV